MKNSIKYVSYYDTPANKAENRGYTLAATNKMDYICTALNQLGYSVEILSASATTNRRGCKGKMVQLSESITLRLLACFGNGFLPKRLLGRFYTRLQLFCHLMCYTQKGDNVLVYHSLGYATTIALARRLKGFRLILEVEEIYADVSGRQKDRKKEFRTFQTADAYLFPTELLNSQINTFGKPYAIIHGTYQVEQGRDHCIFENSGDKKIHCVYAGTFDPRKGGALAAVSAAEFLPANYHIHILGGGTDREKETLLAIIAGLSAKSACGVSYDGLLSGEDYIRFLQSCDIGLSTQNPDAAFNATSFPSKILSYMANGLQVVSIRIPAIEESAIGNCICYYDQQTPEKIAQAIMSADLSGGVEPRDTIAALDRDFQRQLGMVLEG